MNNNPTKIEAVAADLVDDTAQFFAPVSSDLFTQLLGQYQAMRARIEAVGASVNDNLDVMAYFLDGNQNQQRHMPSVDQVFRVKGAIAALNSAYWSKTLSLTDVLDMMPQKRRDEWHTTIREMTTPDYTEEAVRPTITELLNMRATFLAERVDGIFRNLSGDHVTNAPEAFGKRMIFSGLGGYHAYETKGHINDLRCVIAKFMGRDEPTYNATDRLVETLKGNYGQWVSVDGGALRMRLYMKGTAHMEVHPDMAWRLNSILASLYPLAIPAKFRQRPVKKAKEFVMMGRPLPFAVLSLLSSMKQAYEFVGTGFHRAGNKIANARAFQTIGTNKHVVSEAVRVLESIGGAVTDGICQFDYDPTAVLAEIVVSGCVPDQKSHQYYPTPESLARRVAVIADIGPTDTVLEPSAGQGGLADYIPKAQTFCIEISALNCKVLRSKGYAVLQEDFLKWEEYTCRRFDRVVMNPPFDQGRWQSHITAAASVTRGRMVAIVPASAKGKDVLPGFDITWHGPFDNEFAGTSVSVVILQADRK